MSQTPGPWKVDLELPFWQRMGIESIPVTHTDDEGMICVIAEVFKTDDTIASRMKDPEALANAQLIAAAPDLLEACEAALEREEQRDTPAFSSLRAQLRAAIAKAKGEQCS